MSKLVAAIIILICIAINIPGIIAGYWFNWASAIICTGLFCFHLVHNCRE